MSDLAAKLASIDLELIGALCVVSILSGCLVWYVLVARWRTERAALELAADEQRRLDVAELDERLAQRNQDLARQESTIDWLSGRVAALQADLARQSEELSVRRAGEAALTARLEESRKAFADKEALIRAHGESLQREFEVLANRVFEREGEQQKLRLTSVLDPLRDQLTDFRQRVETVYTTDTHERATLLAEVRNLQQASERINLEAGNLTRALRGDVKVQGNWGELVLERVLENSGLRANQEYFLQSALRDEAGALKRPDVIIRLPDGKDVIVDAKLSLVAYEQAVGAVDEAPRLAALRDHVSSLRAHVRRLAEQEYDRLREIRSLDFVLLFVPIEAAFSAAMEHDARLFGDAFQRRIVIVSPTTLMMTLRIIHNVWRYEKQSQNAEEIARRAGALYDKIRGLVEDLETVGRQLQSVDAAYRSAMGKLATGRGNVIRQIEHFRELGATVRQPVPQSVLEEAMQHGLDPDPIGVTRTGFAEAAPDSGNDADRDAARSSVHGGDPI